MKQQQTTAARSRAASEIPPPPVAGAGAAKSAATREETIRCMAYAYYEARGRADGHDLDDWLKAEAAVASAPTAGHSRASH